MAKKLKKKTKKKTGTTSTGTPSGVIKTYEIRKIVKARNIVEAFSIDPHTPPEYLVMIDEGEELEEIKQNIGFKNDR